MDSQTLATGADKASESLLSKFIAGLFSVGLGNIAVMVLGLLGTVFVVRTFPPAVYGTYVLIQVVATFLVRVTGFGLDISVSRTISGLDSRREQGGTIGTALLFRAAIVFPIVVCATYLGKPLLAILFDALALTDVMHYIAVLYIVMSLEGFFNSTLGGLFRFRRVAFASILGSTLSLVLLLVSVLVLKFGLAGLVWSKVAGSLLTLLIELTAIPYPQGRWFDRKLLARLLRFGIPLQINDILTFIFLRIDTLMIGALLGPTQTAFYEVARKIPESISGLYTAFRSVYFPYVSRFFARGESERAARMLNLAIRLLSFCSMFGALVSAIYGSAIITTLFSETYAASAPVFILLMAGLCLTFVDYTLGYTLVAQGDSDKPAYINLVHSSASTLCNYLLIPLLGGIGAAVASLIGFAVANPISVFFLRRRGVRVRVGNYVKPILIFLLAWLPIYYFQATAVVPQVAALCLFLTGSFAGGVLRIDEVGTVVNEIRLLLTSRLVRFVPASAGRRHPS